MHPPPSMIVFTVLTGLGMGMIAWVGLGLGDWDVTFGWIAGVLALMIGGLGGVASVGHLGRPSRAWRAFTQWRSSWLSREACLMVVAKVTFTLYLGLWLVLGVEFKLLGWVAAALAMATVYATAMIYAQLRTVPMWSGTPTPFMFIVLSLTGGLLATGAIKGVITGETPVLYALAWLVVAGGTVVWWTQQAAGAGRSLDGSTMETATGLGSIGRVKMLEAPHTGSNYLLKEMAYQVGRTRAFQLRKIGAIAGFVLPLVLTLLALGVGGWAMLVALVCHIAGMLALRWLFFAEARHVQALYYGMR
ncbi:MAG: DmsC/YnfH family molybdoenzyme membrane anchor subunit [Pseudomonadota bacterium]